MNSTLTYSCLFAFVSTLCACGGSGGSPPTPPPVVTTHTIGGTVNGLVGSGLVLQNNGGNNLAIAASGSFVFNAPLANGTSYNVAVLTQPTSPSQTCTVTNGAAVLTGSNVTNIVVSCADNAFAVGGTVAGLTGTGLVLQNNGGNDLTVATNGTFTFSNAVQNGAGFNVSVRTQPTSTPTQTCSVANGTGTIASATVTNIVVDCHKPTARFLYVPNTSANTVSGFSINASTGALTPIPGSPFANAGAGPLTIAVHPSGSFLYVGGTTTTPTFGGSLSGYTINSNTGELTLIPGLPTTFTAQVVNMSFDRSGNFLFFHTLAGTGSGINVHRVNPLSGALSVTNGSPYLVIANDGVFDVTGSYYHITTTNGARTYALDSNTGQLSVTSAASTPGLSPIAAAVNPLGQIFYMLNFNSTLGSPLNSISVIPLMAGLGVRPPIVGSPFPAGQAPVQALFTGSGDQLYVLNMGISGTSVQVPGPGSISVYNANPFSGQLDPVVGSPFPTNGNNSAGLVIDPSGKYVVATNSASGTISVLKINPTTRGLAHITGSPFTPMFGTTPGIVSFDPSSRFVYVNDGTLNIVSLYSINSTTDAVTFVNSYPTGMGPSTAAPTLVGSQ
jgi:6-phosphogluconolactonase (cycloisomerase 2 family)